MTGLIGAGLGAIANYFSVQSTNQTNYDIARSTNESNRQLAREQREWDYSMWQKQNEYNSPAAQVARLKAAGINPGLAYANGGLMNEAAPAQEAAGSRDVAPVMQAYQVDPLTLAQVGLLKAQTEKVQSETEYQGYINAVEHELANSPIGQVVVTSPEGEESVQVQYGNARALFEREQLKALKLGNNISTAEFADLVFDLAILTGSDAYARDPDYFAPSELPGYEEARKALRGDQNVRSAAGDLAKVQLDAAKAEKAGREAYAKWLDDHKDDPVVKFALTLQGFLQSLGISFPSISVNAGGRHNRSIIHHVTSRGYSSD